MLYCMLKAKQSAPVCELTNIKRAEVYHVKILHSKYCAHELRAAGTKVR